ncbi:MAG: GNAT family N-acetyltransferase [Draconibacterium sp.]
MNVIVNFNDVNRKIGSNEKDKTFSPLITVLYPLYIIILRTLDFGYEQQTIMIINIRKATEADFPAILGLIKELALFEKAPEKVTNTLEQMEMEKDFFKCMVAETKSGEIAGMALYFFAYYTWVGKSLYLDDLYVKENYRKMKIGTALLNEIMSIARAENCKRVRWQVLNWNENAINMYKKSGAIIDGEWLNCDFDATGIQNFNALKTNGHISSEDTSII